MLPNFLRKCGDEVMRKQTRTWPAIQAMDGSDVQVSALVGAFASQKFCHRLPSRFSG